jgi:hypothetical protein
VWNALAVVIGPVAVKAPVEGLNNSAEDVYVGALKVPPVNPPVTSTSPFGNKVAVWNARAWFIVPVAVKAPEVWNNSALAWGLPK